MEKKQLDEFVTKRLNTQEEEFFEPITKNKIYSIATEKKKAKVKKDGKIVSIDLDRQIMSRLVVISSSRDFDLQNLFEYELSTVPLSLFNPDGTIRKSNKSQLLKEMERDSAIEELENIEEENLTIIDFMVIVRMICTDTSKCQTFEDLSETLLNTIFSMFKYGASIDVVCDQYDVVDSIKGGERARRGQVMMQEIKIQNEQMPLPKQRSKFLSNPRNKANLANFLFTLWQEKCKERLKNGQTLILDGGYTDGKKVVKVNCNEHEVLESFLCDHEEADSRIFFHVARATQTYAPRRIIIWSIDTDVASMCPKAVHLLNLQQLFFKTGVKDKKRFILMHDVDERVGSEISQILPLLHAATGCDSTSAFASQGKNTALKAFYDDINNTLEIGQLLGSDPSVLPESAVQAFTRYLLYLYTGNQEYCSLSLMRKELFCRKQLMNEKLPPTELELREHLKRVNYQSHIWMNATMPILNLPTPDGNGWSKDENGYLVPTKKVNAAASEGFVELTTCKCKKGCKTNRCACCKNDLLCSDACYCGDNCKNTDRGNISDDSDDE